MWTVRLFPETVAKLGCQRERAMGVVLHLTNIVSLQLGPIEESPAANINFTKIDKLGQLSFQLMMPNIKNQSTAQQGTVTDNRLHGA